MQADIIFNWIKKGPNENILDFLWIFKIDLIHSEFSKLIILNKIHVKLSWNL